MLDADLAALYRVPTKALVQAVRRNASRFPEDFMFRLTGQEAARLRSQFVTSNVRQGRGGRISLSHEELARKLSALERKYDSQFEASSTRSGS